MYNPDLKIQLQTNIDGSNWSTVTQLLKAGANPNSIVYKNGPSMLVQAIRRGAPLALCQL
jgi:hypothetical protein